MDRERERGKMNSSAQYVEVDIFSLVDFKFGFEIGIFSDSDSDSDSDSTSIPCSRSKLAPYVVINHRAPARACLTPWVCKQADKLGASWSELGLRKKGGLEIFELEWVSGSFKFESASNPDSKSASTSTLNLNSRSALDACADPGHDPALDVVSTKVCQVSA